MAEERGIHSGFLPGFATWGAGATLSASTPTRAPILLRPVQITPRPGSTRSYKLTATNPLVLNFVLVHVLRQLRIDLDDPAELLDRGLPDQQILDWQILDWLADRCRPE